MTYKQIVLSVSVFLAVPALASAATLSVSPSSGTFNVGDSITVNVILDTTGQAIDGADITYLSFNPSLLQAQSVTPGTLMPITISNTIDNTLGRVQFSQVTSGGTKFTGQGTLATVSFKALANGSAGVTFNFTSGNTADTNVASGGGDALTYVANGNFGIGQAATPLSPSPSPSPSPTPAPPPSSTLTESQIQAILSLLSSFGAEQSVINNVSASLRGGATTPSPVPGTGLGRLTAALRVGSRSAQVTILQQMLAKDPSVYPEAKVTGYYGTLTRAAVLRFQAKYGISQVGVVGPITRERLNALYGN